MELFQSRWSSQKGKGSLCLSQSLQCCTSAGRYNTHSLHSNATTPFVLEARPFYHCYRRVPLSASNCRMSASDCHLHRVLSCILPVVHSTITHACVLSHFSHVRLCVTPWTLTCLAPLFSPPGSSVHRILQARILKWVAMPFSRGFSQPRDQTIIFYVSCIGRWVLYHQHHLGSPSCLDIGINNEIQFPSLLHLPWNFIGMFLFQRDLHSQSLISAWYMSFCISYT